jgi:hypothetical protein
MYCGVHSISEWAEVIKVCTRKVNWDEHEA